MIAALVLGLIAVTGAHHAVSTMNGAAQAAFDRGLLLTYAYNEAAAHAAFEEALARDPNLAIAAWGEALADGPNLNDALSPQRFARGQHDIARAQALEVHASAEERAYIEALAHRYAGSYDALDEDNKAYLAAMAALVARYPQDDDAAMLYVEALMEAQGTDKMWDGNAPANPDAAKAIALIQTVLARDPDHIMANHLCIHAYDYAADRTPAIACANRLAERSFEPVAEHLVHMPAHTYIEVGEYRKALEASERSWQMAPKRYEAHDAYTGWTTALMLGDPAASLTWAKRVGAAYQGSDRLVTLARLGRWNDVANASTAGEYYAPLSVGLADVHLGRMADAHKMLALYGNIDRDYRWLLEGAIAQAENRPADALYALQRALAIQMHDDRAETLPIFPAGEFIGAFYLHENRYDAARDAFAQTLQRHPNDPRALSGLAIALQHLGVGAP